VFTLKFDSGEASRNHICFVYVPAEQISNHPQKSKKVPPVVEQGIRIIKKIMAQHGAQNKQSIKIASPPGMQQSACHFPWKLHQMLEDAETEGTTSIVSWLSDNKSFKVHKQEDFVGQIMPRYFDQTKYKSFQRQLNMWCFQRITGGPNWGAYGHELFIRHGTSLCFEMKRIRRTGVKKRGLKAAKKATFENSQSPSYHDHVSSLFEKEAKGLEDNVFVPMCDTQSRTSPSPVSWSPEHHDSQGSFDWFEGIFLSESDHQECLNKSHESGLLYSSAFSPQEVKYVLLGLNIGKMTASAFI
jgi:hypothetical protein